LQGSSVHSSELEGPPAQTPKENVGDKVLRWFQKFWWDLRSSPKRVWAPGSVVTPLHLWEATVETRQQVPCLQPLNSPLTQGFGLWDPPQISEGNKDGGELETASDPTLLLLLLPLLSHGLWSGLCAHGPQS
jgi:hypothetical protein